MSRSAQRTKISDAAGFIAALDQSGGSTPKALKLYGVEESAYQDEEQMFDLVHEMRTRIITSPAFSGDQILAAILFEQTMDRQIEGRYTADYLWQVKNVVPFLKVDKGLAPTADGAQVMKPMPGLAELLDRANERGIFGTKMRSVIHEANQAGIDAVLDQQFEIAQQIVAAGLVPIIEPEVSIDAPDKAAAEDLLLAGLTSRLALLPAGSSVMLKLTLPEQDDLYRPLLSDERILRIVALSGGYSRDEACARLARNHGMTASFSRALTQGLTAQQSQQEFDDTLAAAIAQIYAASLT